MKTNTAYEWCPFCEDEVELKAEFKIQICPNCGRPIIPCSICDMERTPCFKCPLDEECVKLNYELGFND